MMRDLLRRLQVQRKESNLEIEDRIHLKWNSDSADLKQVFASWEEFMAAELLCRSMKNDATLTDGNEIKIGADVLHVAIEKA